MDSCDISRRNEHFSEVRNTICRLDNVGHLTYLWPDAVFGASRNSERHCPPTCTNSEQALAVSHHFIFIFLVHRLNWGPDMPSGLWNEKARRHLKPICKFQSRGGETDLEWLPPLKAKCLSRVCHPPLFGILILPPGLNKAVKLRASA